MKKLISKLIKTCLFAGIALSLLLVAECTFNNGSKLPDPPHGGSNRVEKTPPPDGTVMVDGGDSVQVGTDQIIETPDKTLLFAGTELVKTDSVGNVIMRKHYPVLNSTVPFLSEIIANYDNGYLLVYKSFIYSTYYIELIKTDNAFNKIWEHVIYADSLPDNKKAISYAVSSDDGVWVTGRSVIPNDSLGNENIAIWAYKIDKDNDTVISKRNIDTTIKTSNFFTACIDNNVYIISLYYHHSGVDYNPDITKVNGSGTVEFKKEWLNSATPALVKTTKNNRLIILGYIISDTNPHNRIIAEIDANGNELWSKDYNGYDNNYWGLHSFLPLANGYTLVIGDISRPNNDYPDVWIFKLNPLGDTVWSKTYGGSNEESGKSVVQTTTGDFFIGAETSSYGKDGDDLWLFKTDSNGVMIPLK